MSLSQLNEVNMVFSATFTELQTNHNKKEFCSKKRWNQTYSYCALFILTSSQSNVDASAKENKYWHIYRKACFLLCLLDCSIFNVFIFSLQSSFHLPERSCKSVMCTGFLFDSRFLPLSWRFYFIWKERSGLNQTTTRHCFRFSKLFI